MPKIFWIQVALISFFLALMVAFTRGRIFRGGRWKFGGSRSSIRRGSTGSNSKPSLIGSTGIKTNMKYVAGGAFAGGVGGFKLGNVVRNIRYRFDDDMDYRYYTIYQNQMPNQVYRPMYLINNNSYVSEDRFVTDCYITSMIEYVIKPNEEKYVSDIDQTEFRVKSSVIRQLCVREYKRGPEYYYDSGINLLLSPSLILFITLLVYIVVE